jgi:hypothetical protein
MVALSLLKLGLVVPVANLYGDHRHTVTNG